MMFFKRENWFGFVINAFWRQNRMSTPTVISSCFLHNEMRDPEFSPRYSKPNHLPEKNRYPGSITMMSFHGNVFIPFVRCIYIILDSCQPTVCWQTTEASALCNDPDPSFWIRHLRSFPHRKFPPSPVFSHTDTGKLLSSYLVKRHQLWRCYPTLYTCTYMYIWVFS